MQKLTFVKVFKFLKNVYCLQSIRHNSLLQPAGVTSASCAGETKANKGLVLGMYTIDDDPGEVELMGRFTPAAERYNLLVGGKLFDVMKSSGPPLKKGKVRVFFDLEPEFSCVAVVGIGKECAGYDEFEERDEGKENIRRAAAIGCQSLQELKVLKICVEGFGNAESAAEGAALGVWLYQELRHKSKQLRLPLLDLHDDCDWAGWQIGLQKAAAQNLARQLMETPANLMTPTSFAQNAVEILCKSGVNVEVKVQGWAETQKMGAFLSVSKGSCEAPIFLELSYYGASYDERPIVLVGSGVTFDSGGLCLKDKIDMKYMRGDMAGAACVVATARALAALQLPINVRGLIPLCENMPGCAAFKPGDIVTAMNGKSILVENTDCEGRLLLADAIYYSQNFWPKFIVDVGTLTRDVKLGLGGAATGVFTNSDDLWDKIHMAGIHTGDRMWRLPLWNYFTKQVTTSTSVDIMNVGRGKGGGAAKAAAFLHEFVPCGEWIHLDTFGVMKENGVDHPYLRRGMSGRPTRTLIEFISALVCHQCP
ncbi:cytosol aminopeptidase-like [Anabrus simplex]|uniref:cytosol aminopeptidase-like n=1 Tax=Anabrus simplex TaxID=316456 RepID=UPI0035A35159